MREGRSCYLCGKPATTKDHVPPKALFPKPRPSSLHTLPCCTSCNTAYSFDEEHFRTNVAMLSNPQHARQIWEATRRSYKRRPRIYADIMNRVSLGRFGDKVLPVVRFDAKRTNRVLIKIALGLLFHHTGRRLPSSVKREAFLAEFVPPRMLKLLPKLPHRGRWGKTFAYLGGMSTDDPNTGLWVLDFYASKLFIVEFDSPSQQA